MVHYEMFTSEQIAGFSFDDIDSAINTQRFDEKTIVPLMSRYAKLKYELEIAEESVDGGFAQQNPILHQDRLRLFTEMQESKTLMFSEALFQEEMNVREADRAAVSSQASVPGEDARLKLHTENAQGWGKAAELLLDEQTISELATDDLFRFVRSGRATGDNLIPVLHRAAILNTGITRATDATLADVQVEMANNPSALYVLGKQVGERIANGTFNINSVYTDETDQLKTAWEKLMAEYGDFLHG